MARKPRIEYPGAVYHVLARGNRRERVFLSDQDYRAFLECLGEACERTGWVVHAYVLMGNHYHLLLETPEANLVTGMKWLQGTFTQRYNAAHRLSGHLFQGRYKALIMDPEEPEYFRIVSAYIHLNPARARLIAVDQGESLSAYRWSSFVAYVKPSRRPPWLEVRRVLSSMYLEDSLSDRREYGRYLADRMKEKPNSPADQEQKDEAERVRRGWCLGDVRFRERMLERLERSVAGKKRSSFHGSGRREHDERMAKRMLTVGMKKIGLKEEVLADLPKNDVRKLAVAGWVKSRTVISNGWLAGRLKMGHEMNVSRAIKAYRTESPRPIRRWIRKLEMLKCAD